MKCVTSRYGRQSSALFALPVFSLILATTADAAVGFRQLTTVHPVAVQRGTKREVKVSSIFTLDGTYAVFFNRPGIRMTYAETKPIDSPLRGRGAPGIPYRFNVDVPADQQTGVYEMRLATPVAVSSATHLLVTDYPVIEETPADNSLTGTPQPITLPAAVCGMVDKMEDVDCFKFAAKAGQTLTFQVFAQRVTAAVHDMIGNGDDLYHMNSILVLRNPFGQVCAMNDNAFGGDSLLEYRVERDGDYTLEVRDVRYKGTSRFIYCVEIADNPLVLATYPLAVQRGKSAAVELLGYNLGPKPTATIVAGAADPVGKKEVRFPVGGKPSNFASYLVSDLPQQLAGPECRKRESAPLLNMPTGVSGRLDQPGEEHFFAFDAKKGEYYRFAIQSTRFGLPLDSRTCIYDSKGKMLIEKDDAVFSKDSTLDFQAPADGRYTVGVRDVLGRGGRDYLYYLQGEPSGPDFELTGEHYYAMVAPGTRAIWFARLRRLNGFNEPVEIALDGLPVGVSYTPVTIPTGASDAAVILTGADNAKVGASLVKMRGRAIVKGSDGKEKKLERPAEILCELQSRGGGQGKWPIETQLVGVVEKLDIKKAVAEPKEIVLQPGGIAEIKIRVERAEGFKDPINLGMEKGYFGNSLGSQLPPGVKVAKNSAVRFLPNQTEAKIILEAASNAAPVEKLPVAAVLGVSISFSIDTLYASDPIYLTVAKPADKPLAQKP